MKFSYFIHIFNKHSSIFFLFDLFGNIYLVPQSLDYKNKHNASLYIIVRAIIQLNIKRILM